MNQPSLELDREKLPVILGFKSQHQQAALLYHYIIHTLPMVQKNLKYWHVQASMCHDAQLRQQALASLKDKAFHCQGGAVFAVPYRFEEGLLVQLIVAYQTLCDYLDNLCDRAQVTDGRAFRELHQSLLDALTPDSRTSDYYRSYPHQNDSDYIYKLVNKCRYCIKRLPSYEAVYDDIVRLVNLYIDLQVIKHINWSEREDRLINWANSHLQAYPDILWQEFAAASGSTLAVFKLLGLASQRDVSCDRVQQTVRIYFPWICGLHILLDYFID